MAGLDPAIHVFSAAKQTWITGTSPVMTKVESCTSKSRNTALESARYLKDHIPRKQVLDSVTLLC
jgi:hypothetical protein